MSRYMQYRVPIFGSDDGYIISNCKIYGKCEAVNRLMGDVNRPPIVMHYHYNGSSIEAVYDCVTSDVVPKSVWKNAFKGYPTKIWFLTSVRIYQTGIDFYFSHKDCKKPGGKVSLRAKKDMTIWIRVPRVTRDDSLPDETYLIESVCDASAPPSRDDGYRIRVTEFFRCMKREISVINEPNPYYNPAIHHESLQMNDFLLITELEVNDA